MDWTKIVSENIIHYILVGMIGVLVYSYKQSFLSPLNFIKNGIEEILVFIDEERKKSQEAGNQSIEFWEKKQREAIVDTMRPFLENQTEILKNIASTNQEINKGIIELVTISRNRQ